MRNLSAFSIVFALAFQGAAVAATLSPQEVLRIVLRDNPELKAAEANWQAMKERVPQARAWDDPMVGADVERVGTRNFATYSDVEYMVSQSVPISGKNVSRGRAAYAEALAAYEEVRRIRLDVTSRTRTACYRLANAYGQLRINKRNIDLLQQLSDISRVKYEAGTATQSDVLLVQTDQARLQEASENIQNDIVEQQSKLNVLMNRDATATLGRPADQQFQPVTLSSETIQALALARRPEILRAGKAIAAAKARLQLAHREWIPDPQLRVEARQVKGGSHTGIDEYDTGIFFNVPWVNAGKYSAGVREAQGGVENAEQMDRAARAEVLGMVRVQLQKIETAARNYTLFRDKILPLANQTVETTRAGYESDTSPFLDVITARRTVQDVESAALEHLTTYNVSLAELEAIVGGSISK